MRKIKVFLATFITIVMIATFFSGFALATRVTKANKFIGHVFIDGGKNTKFIMGAEECFFSPSNEQIINRSVQKIQALDGIVEVNRKLAKNGKKKTDGGEKYRKRHDGDDDEDDEIIITEEEEEKNEEEQEKEREQEEKKKQEEEKRQEEERKRKEEKIKKEDWFR
jgi:Mg-chelatase subunit ChlI